MLDSRKSGQWALVIDDYDDAIDFYTIKPDFRLLEDTRLSEDRRWAMVAPREQTNVLDYWRKQRMIYRLRLLVAKQEEGYSYSFLLTTFGGITRH